MNETKGIYDPIIIVEAYMFHAKQVLCCFFQKRKCHQGCPLISPIPGVTMQPHQNGFEKTSKKKNHDISRQWQSTMATLSRPSQRSFRLSYRRNQGNTANQENQPTIIPLSFFPDSHPSKEQAKNPPPLFGRTDGVVHVLCPRRCFKIPFLKNTGGKSHPI